MRYQIPLRQAQDIRARLRRVRGKLTQQQLASALGMCQVAVEQWEALDSIPSTHTLTLLRSRLGINLNWLLLGDGHIVCSACGDAGALVVHNASIGTHPETAKSPAGAPQEHDMGRNGSHEGESGGTD